jgi:hypothetical protein
VNQVQKLVPGKQQLNITNDNKRIESLLKNSLFHTHRARAGSNYNTNQPLHSQRNVNDLSYQSFAADNQSHKLDKRNKSKTKKQNIN